MIRILFVDDEPLVLQSLRAALRRYRERWQLTFAEGGQAALTALGEQRFDVVVTDMRMPQIDGAQVLRAALRCQPWAVRLILSGFTDLAGTLKAAPMAHQVLSKPCHADELARVVERLGQVSARVGSDEVRRVVGSVVTLPSLPESVAQLQLALADARGSAHDVAVVMERDVAMCAKVLQLVNSAFFGLPRHVASVEEAVVLLGFELMHSLALAAQIFSAGGPELAAIELHSQEVAGLARQLAPEGDAGDAYLAGMVHDVGKVVLCTAGAAPAGAGLMGPPLYELERARLGTSHAEVGAYLLAMWGLPQSIIEAVANHHAPWLSGTDAVGTLTAVALADAIVQHEHGVPLDPQLEDHLSHLHLGPTAQQLVEQHHPFQRR